MTRSIDRRKAKIKSIKTNRNRTEITFHIFCDLIRAETIRCSIVFGNILGRIGFIGFVRFLNSNRSFDFNCFLPFHVSTFLANLQFFFHSSFQNSTFHFVILQMCLEQ